MAKKYEVPVRIIFTGIVDTIANNRVEARVNVYDNLNAVIGHINDNNRDDLIIDWNISTHAESIEFGRIILKENE